MAVNQPSFKIFVGTFTPRNTTVSGNDITVYRIGSIKYELAKILDSVEVINDYYDNELGYPDVSCAANILGCNEQIVTTTTTTGSTGATGAQGPQGIQGPPGANGVAGKSTVILFAGDPNSAKPDEDPILIDETITIPTASITDATPNTTDPTKQNQTLQFTFPPISSFTGGGGGSINVNVYNPQFTPNNPVTVANVNAIELKSGSGIDLGIDQTPSTISSHVVRLQISAKIIGFIELVGVSLQNGRYIYTGHPSLFMGDGNTAYGQTDTNQSTEYIEVYNVAEEGIGSLYRKTPPLFAPVTINNNIARNVVIPQAGPLPTSVSIQEIVPLYRSGTGEYFINQPNIYNGLTLQGKITSWELYSPTSQVAKWKYTVTLGSPSAHLTSSDGPLFQAQSVSWSGDTVAQVHAYNSYEITNIANKAYGWYTTQPLPNNPGRFALTDNPPFRYEAVPGIMVDIKIDESGFFYFSAPNPIVGIC